MASTRPSPDDGKAFRLGDYFSALLGRGPSASDLSPDVRILANPEISISFGAEVLGMVGGPVGKGVGNASAITSRKVAKTASFTPEKPLLPDTAWSKIAPDRVSAGTQQLQHQKYNTRTGELERSSLYYDQYGCQESTFSKFKALK